MDNKGIIFMITNKLNQKIYIGQTNRNIDTRFSEIAFDNRSTSLIHKAIQSDGWQNFIIDEIETVPIEQLDERLNYWIGYYNTVEYGYNEPSVAIDLSSDNILIEENNITFSSIKELASMLKKVNTWDYDLMSYKIFDSITRNVAFLGVHFNKCKESTTSIDEQENWVKILGERFKGKHIECNDTDVWFSDCVDAAKYLIEHDYIYADGKYSIQDIVSMLKRKINNGEYIETANKFLLFYEVPGAIKRKDIEYKPVYCPELDIECIDHEAMAKYLIDKKIWTNIKPKTAREKIKYVLTGDFIGYKGLTFVYR